MEKITKRTAPRLRKKIIQISLTDEEYKLFRDYQEYRETEDGHFTALGTIALKGLRQIILREGQ
jgi:hypothetical protein